MAAFGEAEKVPTWLPLGRLILTVVMVVHG